MSPNEYQKLAARTLLDAPEKPLTDNQIMLLNMATGLSGEVGEVVEMIKKHCFHGHALDIDKLSKEVGDVHWYLAGMATKAGFDNEQCMIDNIEKLKARYPDGFSQAASQNRVEYQPDIYKDFSRAIKNPDPEYNDRCKENL